jgi:methionine-rich copper-binding protein CopC
MKRNLLLIIATLLISGFTLSAQDRVTHPVSTARIVGMDGRTELVFEEAITESFTINILDLTGKTVFSQRHQVTSDGCQGVELPVENLRKGIYMVQVMSADGKTKTLKLQRN